MRYKSLIVILLVSLLGALLMVQVLGASAPSEGATISVCPQGPPTCDFSSIQDGVDAAVSGDLVLVSAGTYTGQLQLKDGVVVSSSMGLTDTVITADDGPIVAAENLSATLQGFTLQGPGTMTTATGLKAEGSDLTLDQLAIHSVNGRDFTNTGSGVAANGIYLSGTGSITAENLQIYDLKGGTADLDSAHWVGPVRGLYVEGNWDITIRKGNFHDLEAGSILSSEYDCEYEPPYDASGIYSTGDNNLVVEDSHFERMVGGSCGTDLPSCNGYLYADTVRGIHNFGGSLIVSGSSFENFIIPADSGSAAAIFSYGTLLAELDGNVVENLFDPVGHVPQTNPNCPTGGHLLTGLNIISSQMALVQNNIVRDIYQPEESSGGSTTGVQFFNVQFGQAFNNRIQNLTGAGDNSKCAPCGGSGAFGFLVSNSNYAELNANVVSDVRGGDAVGGFFGLQNNGGAASGLYIENTPATVLTNNIIDTITGGAGNSYIDENTAGEGPGGDASGIDWQGSAGLIANNTVYRTVPGQPGGIGEAGMAVGLLLDDEANIYNNALVQHGTAVSVTAGSTINNNYQGLWDNDQNYSGISAGPNDVVANPQFVDKAGGDFHLPSGSPFIDRSNYDGTAADFDGQQRPLDGDDDGLAAFDLGAYEFWQGLMGSEKSANAAIASAGDTVTYTVSLVNDGTFYTLAGVQLTDSLPVQADYISGSLMVSSGSGSVVSDTLTWLGDIGPGQSVTLIYAVQIDGGWPGPYALVNEAVVTDGIGLPRVLQSVVLVDPIQAYLPVVRRP